jgi:hypothetical protein
MDLYLPDEFYALSEAPNARREREDMIREDSLWLGGEALVAPLPDLKTHRRYGSDGAEPDPIWCVV